MIPTDAVALRVIAGGLRVPTKRLIAMSERHEFPPVYCVGGLYRVSQSAVEAWLERHSASAIAQRRAIADRVARIEAREGRSA